MDSHLYQRDISIDYAYRIKGYRNSSLSGQRARIEAWVCADLQDSGEQGGLMLDFDFLKDVLHEHVCLPCDHALLLDVRDPLVRTLRPTWSERDLAETVLAVCARGHMTTEGLNGKLYLLPDAPTPQNLARHFYERLKGPVMTRSGGRSALLGVRVWKSERQWAGYGPSFGSHTPILEWDHL